MTLLMIVTPGPGRGPMSDWDAGCPARPGPGWRRVPLTVIQTRDISNVTMTVTVTAGPSGLG